MINMLCYSVVFISTPMIKELSKYNLETYKIGGGKNNLISFYNKSHIKYFDFINKISDNILVDSGAFSILNSNPKCDIDKYFKEYYNFVDKNKDNPKIQGFFELDVDTKIGYPKVLEYREQLLKLTNKIIPVWHPSLGISEFKKICSIFDYIGLGGIVLGELSKDKLAPFVNYAHKHHTKIHGLGLTNTKYLKRIPFDSVDSFSWMGGMYAKLHKHSNGKYIAKKLPSKKVREEYYKIAGINYLQSLKFQEYYYYYWRSREKCYL